MKYQIGVYTLEDGILSLDGERILDLSGPHGAPVATRGLWEAERSRSAGRRTFSGVVDGHAFARFQRVEDAGKRRG
jgi:hypothetical protein